MGRQKASSRGRPDIPVNGVEDVYGDQIRVNGQWYHAERVFGRPAGDFSTGDIIKELAVDTAKPKGQPAPDEVVQSGLFRESGANVSHSDEKIARYAEAMRDYGGWGTFPLVYGRVETLTRQDVMDYRRAERGGYARELGYSRPITVQDVGLRYVHLENGHNRSYAAKLAGFDIHVADAHLEEACSRRFAQAGAGATAGNGTREASPVLDGRKLQEAVAADARITAALTRDPSQGL